MSNMLRVELSDFEQLDSVLEEVVRAGANQIWVVEMVVSDVEALAVQARAKAAGKVRAKAEELARLHGRNWARFFESHRTAGETDGEDADDGIGGWGDQTRGAKRDREARSGLRVAIT